MKTTDLHSTAANEANERLGSNIKYNMQEEQISKESSIIGKRKI